MAAQIRIGLRNAAVLGTTLSLSLVTIALGANARPLDEVRDSGELRVFVYSDNQPFSWTERGTEAGAEAQSEAQSEAPSEAKSEARDDTGDEVGRATGIDVDIARAIAEEMKLKAAIYVRPAGEEVDDDLRGNIWQGPKTGGKKADVMMHVPMERELIARNNLVGISNAYYQEQIILAINPEMVDSGADLGAFETQKVAVQFSTSGHYFLAFAREGKVKKNVAPYMKFQDAATEFIAGNVAGLMGRRAEIETTLRVAGFAYRILEPVFPETLRQTWNVGTAVKEDSRDTGYAIGAAFDALKSDGRLEKIFAKYGVTATPPKTR